MPKRKKAGDVITCAQCGIPFIFTSRMMQHRKYCGRECFKLSVRKFDSIPYPQIWYKAPNEDKAKRWLLHRVIWLEAHPEETLTPEDVIHHKDENPFNRSPDNLEKLSGDARAKHLEKHNFHRGKRRDRTNYDPDSDCPF